METGVILLAAGESRRMARPKLLLPWGATSILLHQILVWNALGRHFIGVVCAAGDKAMKDELDRFYFPAQNRIMNIAPEQGMFGSIRCAAEWTMSAPLLTHWVISLGDQPHLRPQTLRALLACGAEQPDKICQPSFNGRHRHPVLLPKEIMAELRTTPASTLREFLESRQGEVVGCEINDPGLNRDIDTLDDYNRIWELYCRGE